MSADPTDPDDKPSFIPEDHLAAIGRIANAWAALEFMVDQLTWRMAEVPHMVGACLTAQMPALHIKLRALSALAELRGLSSDTLKKLKRFQSDTVSALQERRNRAVHDHRVLSSSKDVTRIQITAQGPLVFGFHPEPIAELHNTRKKIEAAIREFQQLRNSILTEYEALMPGAGRPLHDIRNHGPAE